jgi:hypothetical protein
VSTWPFPSLTALLATGRAVASPRRSEGIKSAYVPALQVTTYDQNANAKLRHFVGCRATDSARSAADECCRCRLPCEVSLWRVLQAMRLKKPVAWFQATGNRHGYAAGVHRQVCRSRLLPRRADHLSSASQATASIRRLEFVYFQNTTLRFSDQNGRTPYSVNTLFIAASEGKHDRILISPGLVLTARMYDYIVRTARNRVLPSATRS